MNLHLYKEINKFREKTNLCCGIIIITYVLDVVVYIYSPSILDAEVSSKPDWAMW